VKPVCHHAWQRCAPEGGLLRDLRALQRGDQLEFLALQPLHLGHLLGARSGLGGDLGLVLPAREFGL
jgi:hypothetical protein